MSKRLHFIKADNAPPVWEGHYHCACGAGDHLIDRHTEGYDDQGNEVLSIVCTGCHSEYGAIRFEAEVAA